MLGYSAADRAAPHSPVALRDLNRLGASESHDPARRLSPLPRCVGGLG